MKMAKMMVLTATMLAGASAARGQVHLNDGRSHFMDFDIGADVWIDYDSPGVGTTVNVGNVEFPSVNIKAYQDSWLKIENSRMGGLFAYDRSVVDITDSNAGIRAHDDSTVNINQSRQTGPQYYSYFLGFGNSVVNITGSGQGDIYLHQNSSAYLNNVLQEEVHLTGDSFAVLGNSFVTRMTMSDTSSAVINNAYLDSLTIHHGSAVNLEINDGLIGHLRDYASETNLTVNDGWLQKLDMPNGTNLTINGGAVNINALNSQADITMTGGTLWLAPSIPQKRLYESFNMHGGRLGTDYLWFERFHMTGGIIQADVTIGSRSIEEPAYWSGGFIEGNIGLDHGGVLMIAGYDFALDGQPIIFRRHYTTGQLAGRLTGTLANGDPLDKYVDFTAGTLVLVPEPATVALLGLGSLLVAKKRG